MNANTRRIIESPFYIGEDEGDPLPPLTIPASWAPDPSEPVVIVYNSAGEDVTEDITEGECDVVGQVITFPQFTGVKYRERNDLSEGGFVAGEKYTLVVRFATGNGGDRSCLGEIVGQK